ncbi:MAG: hypothetical protein IPM11_01170 [Micropruina sp.]|nr:hypothetical protein [Micropruina sp.]
MIIKMIEGFTRVLGKSQGYLGLPVRDEIANCNVNGAVHTMVTAWEPTPGELQALNAGGAVYLRVLGVNHPPIMVWAEGPKTDG